jgi:hypothetical protein
MYPVLQFSTNLTLQSILHQVFSLIPFAKWVVKFVHVSLLNDYMKVCNLIWEFFVGFCNVDVVCTLFSLISYIHVVFIFFIYFLTNMLFLFIYLLVFLILVCFVDSLMTHVWWSIKVLLSYMQDTCDRRRFGRSN